MTTFAVRHASWERYLPLLDAALCEHWDEVGAIARAEPDASLQEFLLYNDLAPTLYWLVQRAGASSALPAQLLLELMGSAGYARVTNEELLRVLAEVADAAADAGVTLATLKGLHHTQMLYGDINARRIRDIDILVAPTQRAALEHVLSANGFAPGPRLPLDRYLAHATHWRRGSTELDVHHALRVRPGYRLDNPGFLARCHEELVFSVPLRVPDYGDTLLLLLLSLSHDLERGAVRARSLVDLCIFLRRGEVREWPQVFAAFEAQAVAGLCRAALSIVATAMPGAMATVEGLSVVLADSPQFSRRTALELLAGKPRAGRRWYMRHGPLHPTTYLAWYVGGLPLRRWLNR